MSRRDKDHQEKHRLYLSLLERRQQLKKQLGDRHAQAREQGFQLYVQGANSDRSAPEARPRTTRTWEHRSVEIKAANGQVYRLEPPWATARSARSAPSARTPRSPVRTAHAGPALSPAPSCPAEPAELAEPEPAMPEEIPEEIEVDPEIPEELFSPPAREVDSPPEASPPCRASPATASPSPADTSPYPASAIAASPRASAREVDSPREASDSPPCRASPATASPSPADTRPADAGTPDRSWPRRLPSPPVLALVEEELKLAVQDGWSSSEEEEDEETVLEQSLEVTVRGGSDLADLRHALAAAASPRKSVGALELPKLAGKALLEDGTPAASLPQPGMRTLAGRILGLPTAKREALLTVLSNLEGTAAPPRFHE